MVRGSARLRPTGTGHVHAFIERRRRYAGRIATRRARLPRPRPLLRSWLASTPHSEITIAPRNIPSANPSSPRRRTRPRAGRRDLRARPLAYTMVTPTSMMTPSGSTGKLIDYRDGPQHDNSAEDPPQEERGRQGAVPAGRRVSSIDEGTEEDAEDEAEARADRQPDREVGGARLGRKEEERRDGPDERADQTEPEQGGTNHHPSQRRYRGDEEEHLDGGNHRRREPFHDRHERSVHPRSIGWKTTGGIVTLPTQPISNGVAGCASGLRPALVAMFATMLKHDRERNGLRSARVTLGSSARTAREYREIKSGTKPRTGIPTSGSANCWAGRVRSSLPVGGAPTSGGAVAMPRSGARVRGALGE